MKEITLTPAHVAALLVAGSIILTGLLGVILAGIFRFRFAQVLPERLPPSTDWRGREALEAILLFIFLQILLGGIATTQAANAVLYPYLVMGGLLLAGILTIAWMKLSVRPPAVLGWRWHYPKRFVLIGLVAGGAMVIPAQTLLWVVTTVFHLPPEEHPLVPVFLATTGFPVRLFLILSMCVIIPAVEETVFRGLLYGALRRSLSSFVPAALISAIVFALGHASLSGFLAYVLIGYVLAWLYERTGSLLTSTAAHCAFNSFGIAILSSMM